MSTKKEPVAEEILKNAYEAGLALADEFQMNVGRKDSESNRLMELAFLWGLLGYPWGKILWGLLGYPWDKKEIEKNV
jgi:hypothetical protein